MTDRAECGACGKPMNAASAACPHCGARVDGADPPSSDDLGGVRISVDEARALIAADGGSRALQPAAPGLFGLLVLPHPMTSGASRVAEVGLTVTGLPILMCSALLLAILPRTYRNVSRTSPGELRTPLLASIFGVPTLAWLLMMGGGIATGTAFGVAAGLASSLFVRAGIRARAARRDPKDLFRKPKPERPAKPELPVARARRAPSEPSEPPDASSPPVSEPSPSPAGPPPDASEGPSFLK